MKTLFTFIVTCLFFSETFPQAPVFALPTNVFYIHSTKRFVKEKEGYLGLRLNGLHKTNPYARRLSISLVSFNEKMVEQKENKLSDGEHVYSMLGPQILKGKKIWVICGDPGKSWNLGNIRAVEIDPLTYKPGASKVLITQEELDETGQYGFFELKIKSSPNANYHSLYFGADDDKEFYLACFNSDLEPVWKGKIEIPDTKTHKITDMSINDNGEIIVASTTKSKPRLSIYDLKGGVIHKPLDLGTLEPEFITILQSQTGTVYIGGTGMRDSKLENTVFLAKLEKDHTLSNMKQIPITDDILDGLAKHGLAKTDAKKRGLVGAFIHSELVEQQDGKIKLVTETTYGDQMNNAGQNNDMGFGGLIITDFSKTEGQFDLIPKFMVWVNQRPRINQFVAVPSLNSITLFYCDNAENINIDLKERQKTLNGPSIAALYAANIDNNGVIKREIIASKANKEENRTTVELIMRYLANKK